MSLGLEDVLKAISGRTSFRFVIATLRHVISTKPTNRISFDASRDRIQVWRAPTSKELSRFSLLAPAILSLLAECCVSLEGHLDAKSKLAAVITKRRNKKRHVRQERLGQGTANH